ncbi:MAG TPA: hemolysin III family protein [Pseudonocardia sp.]
MTTLAPKPLLRGSLHRWSLRVSILPVATLVSVSGALVGATAAIVTSIYGATMVGLFGVSTVYHRSVWTSPRHELIMRRLDLSMIFLFIAGTYTPLAVFALPPAAARGLLIVVWTGALVGVTARLFWPTLSPFLAVPIYLALGWIIAFFLPELLHRAGTAALVLVLVGCALYTVGGAMFASRWPDPWPAKFGYHEFFHAATVLAALCHHIAIWLTLF